MNSYPHHRFAPGLFILLRWVLIAPAQATAASLPGSAVSATEGPPIILSPFAVTSQQDKGKFGPTDHTLIVTGNASEGSTRRYWHSANLPRFSLFSPPDWKTYNFAANEAAYVASSDTESTSESRDFGLQDNIALFNRRLIAVAGARYDSGKGTSRNNPNGTTDASANSDWTYKAGLVGSVLDGVSVFINRSTTAPSASPRLTRSKQVSLTAPRSAQPLRRASGICAVIPPAERRLVSTDDILSVRTSFLR